MTEKQKRALANEIYKLQAKVDELMDKLWLKDEILGSEVTEVIEEGRHR